MIENRTCCPVTVFEGPDGGGKTTAAVEFARMTKAHYVHFNNLPGVYNVHIARLYIDAMAPALLGYQPVVLDRAWPSEIPYADAFRGGRRRLQPCDNRMIEREALRCGLKIVLCMPPEEVVIENFRKKTALNPKAEYLNNEHQLSQVYAGYVSQAYHGRVQMFDYRADELEELIDDAPRHPAWMKTGGNWGASIVMVGDEPAPLSDLDSFYTSSPFVDFKGTGCSRWLAAMLDRGQIDEKALLWINSDNLPALQFVTQAASFVIALGRKAEARLTEINAQNVITVPHPQAWKRFKHGEYPLINVLRDLTRYVDEGPDAERWSHRLNELREQSDSAMRSCNE